MTTSNGRTAAIIGAGQTGVTAALGLLDNGFDVTIYSGLDQQRRRLCRTLDERRVTLMRIIDEQRARGTAGALFWAFMPDPRLHECTLDIGPDDPLLGMVGKPPP